MKTLAIIRLAFCMATLIGCNRDPGRSGGSLGLTPTQPPPVTTPTAPTGKLLGIGVSQSNGDALFVNGSDEMYRMMAKYVTIDFSRFIFVRRGCSWGGTNATDWIPGAAHYEECMANVKEVMDANPGSKVLFLAHIQGENEAQTGNPWAVNVEAMISDIKARTNSPDMVSAWERINKDFDPGAPFLAQVRVEAENMIVRNGRMVDTDGCALGPDGVHYKGTDDSAGELGRRYGEALGRLLQ